MFYFGTHLEKFMCESLNNFPRQMSLSNTAAIIVRLCVAVNEKADMNFTNQILTYVIREISVSSLFDTALQRLSGHIA